MMITQEMVERINELYRKSKAEGLTKEEAREQAELRSLYLDAIRTNIRSNLDTIKIQQPDGTLIDVKKRHEEKMKKMNENMNN
ncbi:MAG: DUF896 domain-containing protein [Lachnospiraceae bacterium]